MEISDGKVWQTWVDSNEDSYGSCIIRYAERWADLMEDELAFGNTLEKCAKETSHRADTSGITGFMYGAAVSVLSSCWKYGEQLRRWHNLATQIHDEGEKANEDGGVLNPALVNIRTSDG